MHDSDGEDDGPGVKRVRVPSAVCRELPTRAAVLRAQGDDEQARKRNRRIFGSLLGTLQKFKQEEIVLQTKVRKEHLWKLLVAYWWRHILLRCKGIQIPTYPSFYFISCIHLNYEQYS